MIADLATGIARILKQERENKSDPFSRKLIETL